MKTNLSIEFENIDEMNEYLGLQRYKAALDYMYSQVDPQPNMPYYPNMPFNKLPDNVLKDMKYVLDAVFLEYCIKKPITIPF